MADPGDRGHLDGVVKPSVPAPAQPVDRALAGGHLDRRGAVLGDEAVRAGETGHVAYVADDSRSHDRANPNRPVRLVPAAWTAAASFLRVPGICVSIPRRSSTNSAASSQRAASTARRQLSAAGEGCWPTRPAVHDCPNYEDVRSWTLPPKSAPCLSCLARWICCRCLPGAAELFTPTAFAVNVDACGITRGEGDH
jgi:hypothetical protein